MTSKATAAAMAAAFILVTATSAVAHTLPWRAGESRQIGWGHCAKGPCMKRSDFSPSKPHRHIGPGLCGIVDMKGQRLYPATCS